MKYGLIIFDADETLFDFKKSEKVALESTMKDFSIDYEEGYHLEIYKEINSAVWKELEKGLITQKELNDLRFQRLLERLKVNRNALEFAGTYIKHLSRASFLYEESLDLIENLSKDYRMVILSNGLKDVQDNRLRKSILSGYFEDIIISEEVGLAKPDPAIFELLFRHIRYTEKSKALMIGDSLSSDIQGGINFGIDTCWLNAGKAPNRSEIKPTFEINRLEELYALLQS
ncbi:MAG TPA: YjjG family noncanonical pyrimidine nucleotidase [Anaerovoracaceae bacterium]|nr:YjjG family noncanonical pyrimidine nucleotidase [Anaerovoracaceae bacterium]